MKIVSMERSSQIVVFSVCCFALLIFTAGWIPSGWNWGFHFLGFYGQGIIILIPLLMVFFLFPPLRNFLITKMLSAAQWFSRQRRMFRIVVLAIGCCGLVYLFWAFRVRSYFLGDGQLILRTISNVGSSHDLVFAYKREPMVGFCILMLSNLFITLKSVNPTGDAYTWLSIFSGIGFAFLAWKITRYFSQNILERCFLFFLLLSTGMSQLFFGYTENYTPGAVCILLFLFFSISYIKKSISIVWAITSYGVALTFHFGAVIFFPAVIFLCSLAIQRKHFRELLSSFFLAGVVFVVLLLLVSYPFKLLGEVFGGTGHHLVPFSLPLNKYQAYTLFSLNHVLDIANFLVLQYPAFLILLAVCIGALKFTKKSFPPETRFFLLAGLCGIGFIFIFNCELGMSRDWDILAPISIGIPIAILCLWKTIPCEQIYRHHILLSLCAVSLFHTGVWIGVNSDADKAEKRFTLLENESRLWSSHAHLDACEVLAVHYRERKELDRTIHYYKKYIAIDSSNARLWINLASMFQQTGNTKESIETYTAIIRLGLGDFRIYTNLALLRAAEKNYSEALTLFKRAEQDAPQEPFIQYSIGRILMDGEHKFQEALPYFHKAIRFDSSFSEAYHRAGQCYFHLGNATKAEQYLALWKKITGGR